MGGLFVDGQFEIDLLPDREHVIEHIFDIELFFCAFPYIATGLAEGQQSHIDYILETETVSRGLHTKTHFLRYLLPMPIFHAGLSESHHKRGFRSELLNLFLDDFIDFAHGFYLFVLKITLDPRKGLYAVFHEFFSACSVEFIETAVQPLGTFGKPLIRGQPQIAVGLEVFDHLIQLGVVRCVLHVEKTFLHVEFPGVILVPEELFIDGFHVLSDVIMIL